MLETTKPGETLYPHELLYKTRSGVIFSLFVIGFILSIIVNTMITLTLAGAW